MSFFFFFFSFFWKKIYRLSSYNLSGYEIINISICFVSLFISSYVFSSLTNFEWWVEDVIKLRGCHMYEKLTISKWVCYQLFWAISKNLKIFIFLENWSKLSFCGGKNTIFNLVNSYLIFWNYICLLTVFIIVWIWKHFFL